MSLARALRSNKTIRSIGFDDEPFERGEAESIGIAGVVCKETRFDGMVWGQVEPDGWDATDEVCRLLEGGKFLQQLHVVLLDGIAFGGFNVIDIAELSDRLALPCIAVTRQPPDFEAIEAALQHLDAPEKRLATIHRAGDVQPATHAHFQAHGCSIADARKVVDKLTVVGHIPEPIRIAHLVATAVSTGESGRRA